MRALIALCVRRHGAVSLLTLLALILGAVQAIDSNLDVFPEWVPSQVEVQTEAPGFTAQQVEELITKPVENSVSGATGVATMRSESIPGLSVISVTFDDRINIQNARQGISERLSELGSTLPVGVGTPKLSPLISSTMDLVKVGLTSERVDPFTLRDTADWVLKPRLLAVPGVAHVIVFGGEVRQIQVLPDPVKLASFGLSLTDVADAAKAALPLRGVGFIDTPEQRILLKSPTPEPDLATLQHAVVTNRNGTPVLLGELAAVRVGPAIRAGDSLIMGKPGVLLSLASQYGANTLTVTHALEKTLDDLEPALKRQGITLHRGLHRPANFIEAALKSLEHSLVIAAVLILVVLLLFMRDIRAALIAFTAIPLSMLAAITVLKHMGQTLNTMTMGGLAVALGVLVDDAIIDIENIMRRLRENAKDASPRPRLEVLLEASLEIRYPVIYATAVVILVFLPQLFTTSLQGKFVGPLALAFILAVLASLLVAMISTPALCALLLKGRESHADSGWIVRLKSWQRSSVGFVSHHLRATMILLTVLVVAAVATLPFLSGTFMPEFREGHLVMQVSSALPGTSLDEMLNLGRRISADVLALPYVKSISQQVGHAELSEDTWGPHRSEFHVELKPDTTQDQAEAEAKLREILTHYPGTQNEVVTFLGDRISESLSGVNSAVVVKLFGENLEELDAAGAAVADAIAHVKGAVDLQFKRESAAPVLSLKLKQQALAVHGIKGQEVLDALEGAYAGRRIGQTFVGTRTVDTVILLPDALRRQPASLGELMISSPSGPVPLKQVANIELVQDRFSIQHDGGQRLVTVGFNIEGRSTQDVVADAQHALAGKVTLPAGVYLEFSGQAEAERQTRNQLIVYSSAAVIAILMLLFTAFHWRANAWLVLLNLPFSLIGAVLVIALAGLGISLGTILGLVTVFGISARNAILLLAHYEHLVEHEGQSWNEATVLRGANERFIPILMTAAMTAIGLLPLALGLHSPGQEIEGPMAVTVLGGLVSSTLLNLLVLPALAQHAKRREVSAAVH